MQLPTSILTAITIVVITLSGSTAVFAQAPAMASPSGLSLLELKITGDEFVILQNNSTKVISDLSSYWLTAYNATNPLAAGVVSSTQQLPGTSLLPGQTMLLSDNSMATCGASVAGKLSLSFSDGGGYLSVSQASLSPNGTIIQTPGDVVSWSSSLTAGIITGVPSSTKDPKAIYYRYLNGTSYTWQLADSDATNNCQLNIVVAGGTGSSSAVTPLTLAATSPPATILEASGTVAATPNLPIADSGLIAPQLSELVPNPEGSNNDNSAEFIELYNPNQVAFDLSGFSLQTGGSRPHIYTFPDNTILTAQSFHSFFSAQTHIALSNSGGQVYLLDPAGQVISMTTPYGAAKDGQAWAIANNTWYWTTRPTPSAANVIAQPLPAGKAPSTTAKKVKATKTKVVKVKKAKTAKKKVAVTNSALASQTTKVAEAPVHVWILALIAGGAVLYGAYEYRHDMANRLRKLSANYRARRSNR